MKDKKTGDNLPNKLKDLSTTIQRGAIVKMNTSADAADILSYLNKLWTVYLTNPTLLYHDQWEFLSTKLDTLNIDDEAKKRFCDFRVEYDT